jgi:glycosyltransferase involved in cell wall biosynthesis
VLIQGVPFDVIPRSVATVRRLDPCPWVVTLPHFHGDDRFYYWRRYLDSFKAADATLLFSSSIANRMGLRDRFPVVPGGGVRVEECGDKIAAADFYQVHRKHTPFFLVLGRKAPAKGYKRVLSAHALLRRDGIDVDLVLIGPDEDGVTVEGEGVHYLGRQPRQVILGALSKCLCLVNMSTSESFGIVICEAWLSAKPVIVNRACYAFRELVREGVTGLLAGSDQELREAMARLASDTHARDSLGMAGFAEVVARYTWRDVGNSIFNIIEPDGVGAVDPTEDLTASLRTPRGSAQRRPGTHGAPGTTRRVRQVSRRKSNSRQALPLNSGADPL